ncbi:hypothetical protein BHE74_00013311 [Ensete ventricosum]|nr:hypothetical protein BHE74_00013311 [Ensete ventricosum]
MRSGSFREGNTWRAVDPVSEQNAGRCTDAAEDQGRPITAVSCACGERHALRDRSISWLGVGGVGQYSQVNQLTSSAVVLLFASSAWLASPGDNDVIWRRRGGEEAVDKGDDAWFRCYGTVRQRT